MNFFRRNSTKIPTPIELEVDAMDLPKIRLWGSIFFYTPRPLPNPRARKTSALCYRGSTYDCPSDRLRQRELPTPPVKANGKITTLTYRGSTYDCQLPIPVVETEGKTVVLIYRGHTYERKLPHPQPYQQPRVINWRWQ
jgi:Domain of unknown function (DUF4278)